MKPGEMPIPMLPINGRPAEEHFGNLRRDFAPGRILADATVGLADAPKGAVPPPQRTITVPGVNATPRTGDDKSGGSALEKVRADKRERDDAELSRGVDAKNSEKTVTAGNPYDSFMKARVTETIAGAKQNGEMVSADRKRFYKELDDAKTMAETLRVREPLNARQAAVLADTGIDPRDPDPSP